MSLLAFELATPAIEIQVQQVNLDALVYVKQHCSN